MNRINNAFRNGKAFIAFLTGGDPDIETTEALIPVMEAAGADIIEIGIPFSDPIAEGPVIQAASARSLAAGCTVDRLFDMVARVRKNVKITRRHRNPVPPTSHENQRAFFTAFPLLALPGYAPRLTTALRISYALRAASQIPPAPLVSASQRRNRRRTWQNMPTASSSAAPSSASSRRTDAIAPDLCTTT